MKKLFLISVFASLLLLTLASACDTTYVTGVVYRAGGTPTTTYAWGTNVTAECNGHVLTGITLNKGEFTFAFTNYSCPLKTITITADTGSWSGNNSSLPYLIDNDNCNAEINVELQNTPLVPEFSFLIGAVTLIAALAAFFVIRKK